MTTEKTDDALAETAKAEEMAALAAAEEAKAAASKHIAEAGVSATAAAEAAKALAETTAAQTINENKDDLQWLHRHATETGNSLKELRENQEKIVSSLPLLFQAEREATLSKMAELLTPLKSTLHETPPVNPEAESALEDDKKAGEKKQNQKDLKRKRNWT